MTHVMSMVNRLRIHVEYLINKNVVEKVIRPFLKKFIMVVHVIEESKYLTQISIEELMGSLLSKNIESTWKKILYKSPLRQKHLLVKKDQKTIES